jgi:hypothetical protein
LFYDDEVKNLLPDVFEEYARDKKNRCFIKIHDAYTYNGMGKPIVPTTVSSAVLYLVRNPLDIIASLASHVGTSFERAVNLMNDPNGYMVEQHNNHNVRDQFPQLLLDWSGHVQSWLEQGEIPVHLIRYEDLKSNPEYYFEQALGFIKMDYKVADIKVAVQAAEFSRLKGQELKFKFRENSSKNKSFFRYGEMNRWKVELKATLVESIAAKHFSTMQQLRYL